MRLTTSRTSLSLQQVSDKTLPLSLSVMDLSLPILHPTVVKQVLVMQKCEDDHLRLSTIHPNTARTVYE